MYAAYVPCGVRCVALSTRFENINLFLLLFTASNALSHLLSPFLSHSIRSYKYPTTEAADSPVRIMEASIRSRRWVGQRVALH